MATLREALAAKGDSKTLQALDKIGKTDLLDVDEHDVAVTDTLLQINTRGKNKSKRLSSKQGPITPEEFADLLHSNQSVAEILSNTDFVTGIRFYVEATTKGERYQVCLGEFVRKYEQQPADVQKAIRSALVLDGTEVKNRFEGKTEVSAAEQLAEVLFCTDEKAWEVSGNRQLLAMRRINNWKHAYDESVGEAHEKTATAEQQKRFDEGKPKVEDIETDGTYSVLNAASDKPETASKPRKSTYTIIADMYWQIGTDPNVVMTPAEQLKQRSFLLSLAFQTGLDKKKIQTEIDRFEPFVMDGLERRKIKTTPKPEDKPELLQLLKDGMKKDDKPAKEKREATETEPELEEQPA